MKKAIIIVLIIVAAVIVTVSFKIPALEYVAKFFDIVKLLFATLAQGCRWLQDLVNLGVIK